MRLAWLVAAFFFVPCSGFFFELMAKGNLFLGFASGKVGDVVMYRSHGEQVSRARNRSPKNPNTIRQQVQRAVSASVQRLYSAGQAVFNHAFEGRKVGMQNQMEFVRRNMAILRALVVDDLNTGRVDGSARARVSAPGLSVPVPFDGLMISSGSLQQTAFSWNAEEGYFELPDPLRQEESGQIMETVGAYANRVGLVEGDIYTFVVFGSDPLEGTELGYYGGETFTNYAAIFNCFFNFAQMRVKSGATSDGTMITTSTTYAALFEPAAVGVDLTGAVIPGSISGQLIDSRAVSSAVGCIRSREDSGKRSVSFLHLTRGAYDWGLSSNWLSAAWSRSSQLAGVDLILDGRDFITPDGFIITPSFDFPLTVGDLNGQSLAFSSPVTISDVAQRLTFSTSGSGSIRVALNQSTGNYALYDGMDYFGSVSLSADGLSLSFTTSSGGPTLTSLAWS